MMVKRAVRVHAADSVATALADLEAGDAVLVSERDGTAFAVEVLAAVPFGHKLALRAVAQGDDVFKYGQSIGEATEAIEPGSYVHVHNLASRRARSRSDDNDR